MPAPSTTAARSPFALGLLVALFSAATFGSSGTFGAALLEAGWTPGALVTARITGAALVMAVPAVIAMRGHWHLLRRNVPRLLAYGVFAVAGCQFAYFMAVDHLSVGVALLLEYLAPVLIVGWVWARHGRRPSRLTAAGVGAAYLTAYVALVRLGMAQPGEWALIHGASGGVGSLAVAIFSQAGYTVHAISGKTEQKEYLLSLGAAEVLGRDALATTAAMASARFGGGLDNVGGAMLAMAADCTSLVGCA